LLCTPTHAHARSSWRHQRKAAHKSFQKSLVSQYHDTQTAEAQHLVGAMLAEPAQWAMHFRRTTASVIMSIVYDSPTIDSQEDTSVTFVSNMVARLAHAGAPGAHLVEFAPFLKAIPSR
jgi:cytochrome P450